MRLLSILPLWLLAHGVAAAEQQCKCAPTDSCWPSDAKWSSLNETVSGRLIKTIPPGSVCYQTEPDYNRTACDLLLKNWPNSEYHSSNPVTVSDPLWSNSSCTPIYPNGTSISGDPNAGAKGCSLGYLSAYVVNATSAQHVKATLHFVKEHNLRLNIKNTGHNPEKSQACRLHYKMIAKLTQILTVLPMEACRMIWTHHMKHFKLHHSFKSSNCSAAPNHMVATIGAGTQDGELFEKLKKFNLTAVGGTSMDVGVTGWATGGGHGVLTGVYGMGADNIIEAEIVTPDGQTVTANECQNKDLFWAIRGGGGGTFGVILSLTVNVFPIPSLSTATVTMSARNGTSAKKWWTIVASAHKEMIELQDAGVMGCYTIGGSPYSFQYTMFQLNTTNTTSIDRLISPLTRKLQTHNQSIESSSFTTWLSSWTDVEKITPSGNDAGVSRGSRATRLLPREAVKDTDFFARTLEIVGPQAHVQKDGISGLSISGTMTISRKPVDNALNPAWRDAAVHFITSESWDDTLPVSAAETAFANMTNVTGYALRQLAPTRVYTIMRQILGNQTGNGRFGDRITPDFFQSSRSMILEIFCGVITV
ncbi:putative FAD-linked oxidoreductase [Penicillium rolfsii]|nr:putative FAD-linked oxidoreductase [Penicillium rolfsii]